MRDKNGSRRALDLVRLPPLMELTEGQPEIKLGIVDGPVARGLADLPAERLVEVSRSSAVACGDPGSAACEHGTIVTSVLGASRGSAAPAICPGCTLIARPIFREVGPMPGAMPSSTAEDLAAAVIDCIEDRAHVINLSLAVLVSSSRGERELGQALDYAARRGVIVVAAAGNQGTIGSSVLTRHPWVIPVVGCDLEGVPLPSSNLGASSGRRGLAAPGTGVVGLGPDGSPTPASGTSVSAPLVAGAIALLWSEFPRATAAEIKLAVLQPHLGRKVQLVPPLLDAWGAFTSMQRSRS